MKVTTEKKLVDLIEKYILGIDEEMEHGCYSAPDGIPYEYSNEKNYYGKHENIVWRNAKTRVKIEKLIEKYKKEIA